MGFIILFSHMHVKYFNHTHLHTHTHFIISFHSPHWFLSPYSPHFFMSFFFLMSRFIFLMYRFTYETEHRMFLNLTCFTSIRFPANDNFIFLYGWTVLHCVCISHFLNSCLMGTWANSTAWLLWIVLLKTWVFRHLDCMLTYIPLDRCSRVV
jgi:hypothetical protein